MVALALFSKRLLKKSGIRRSDSSSLIASNGMGGLGVNEGFVKLRLEALCVRLVPEFVLLLGVESIPPVLALLLQLGDALLELGVTQDGRTSQRPVDRGVHDQGEKGLLHLAGRSKTSCLGCAVDQAPQPVLVTRRQRHLEAFALQRRPGFR